MRRAARRTGGQAGRRTAAPWPVGLRWLGGAFTAWALLSACPPVRLSAQQTSLTIYNDGRVLVRRTVARLLTVLRERASGAEQPAGEKR